MGPRRQGKKKLTGKTQASSTQDCSSNESVTGSENGDGDSTKFELFVRKKLSEILNAQASLEEKLARSIEFNSGRITNLEATVKEQGKEVAELKKEVTTLKGKMERQEREINKNERFSRRNNFRLVGIPKEPGENCEEIVRSLLTEKFEWGDDQPTIERAHRDGPSKDGRTPHILVKLLSYQDKVYIMRNARQKMQESPYYILDDLTLEDLREKKKWKEEVKTLFDRGIKLKFVGGRWRSRDGTAYKFE